MKKQILLFLLMQCGVMMHSFAQNVNASATNGASGSYATLKGAFDDINSGVLQGAITITVVGNTVETASAVLNSSFGTAVYTSVSIAPSGGVWTISGNLAGLPLVDFNGSDSVKINGLNALTFSNTSTANTAGTSTIRFMTDACADTVTNCTILGSSTSTINTASATIVFGSTSNGGRGNDNNAITNCIITAAGSNLPSKAIFSLGNLFSPSYYNSGNTINNCKISDYFSETAISAGIVLANATNNCIVSNNKFYQTGLRTQTAGAIHAAVYVLGTSGSASTGYSIINNTIGFADSNRTGMYSIAGTTATQVMGIYYASVPSGATASIQGNTITNIAVSGSIGGNGAASPFIGISMTSSVASIGNVTPNIIGSPTSTGVITMNSSAASIGEAIGIYMGGASNSVVSNNIIGGILVSNSSTGAANLSGIRTGTSITASYTFSGNTIGGAVANSMQSNSSANGTQVIGITCNGPISTVSGNTIRNLTAAGGTGSTTGASVSGIVLAATVNGQTVTQNTIYNLNNTNTLVATVINGIYYSSTVGSNNAVSSNNIHSFGTASNTAIQYGIYINQGGATYSNNTIRLGIDGAGANVATGTTINGIFESTGTNNLYYNSVYIGGSLVTSALNSYAFQSTAVTNTRNYINNSFYNARSNGTGTGKHYAVMVGGTAANPAGLTMNNNLMFTSGTGGVFGYYNSADVPDLASWITAVGSNTASLSVNPLYAIPTGSASTVDLAPTASSPLINNGTALASVTIDMAGITRSLTTPTIGAGETTKSLPVEWISFTAKRQPKNITLTWVTASEINNSHFVVQRSEDGKIFMNIAKVKGQGTTASANAYVYTDAAVPAGTNTIYYRLIQVDFDRNEHTSSVVSVVTASEEQQEKASIQVSPNPFADVASVVVNTDKAGSATLKIADIQGRIVVEKNIELQQGLNNFSIDEMSSDTYNGIYFVMVATSSATYTQHMVKTK